MVKEFKHLKKQLVQSLKETHQHKQLLDKANNQFEQEQLQMFRNIIAALSVLEKQLALAQKLPNKDDRAVKFLLEIYENHRNTLEDILTNAGVTILPNNALDTATLSDPIFSTQQPNKLVHRRYFYKDKPLTK